MALPKSVFFINNLSFSFIKNIIKIKFMKNNLYEIDSAMNMIKEDIIKELSESVSKQNKESFCQDFLANRLSFSENIMD